MRILHAALFLFVGLLAYSQEYPYVYKNKKNCSKKFPRTALFIKNPEAKPSGDF